MKLRAGLIGDPVTHSLSPQLHNAAFAQIGIVAEYELWPTPAAELADRVASLRAADVLGANVTLPHKRAVMPFLDAIDPQAALIGAINTIVRSEDGVLKGFNTDAPAFLMALQEDAQYRVQGQSVVVLGASGAARAAVAALLEGQAAHIVVVNRTLERAEALLADVLEAGGGDPHLTTLTYDDPTFPQVLQDISLIVNATSLGWKDDETPLEASLISSSMLIFDMVYRSTRLLREATERGAQTHDGLTMLVRQAALAFQHWTGEPAPLDAMYAAVRSVR